MNDNNEKEFEPYRLLELWEGFIVDCEEGYYWDFGEYMNEIEVRDSIHRYSKECWSLDFNKKLLNLDNRFAKLLKPDVLKKPYDSWWKNGVLKFAGKSYGEYMRAAGIDVKLV